MLAELPDKRIIEPAELPTDEHDLFAFRLRAVLTKPITFTFRGEGRPFISSLIALAQTLEPSQTWENFEDYPCWFKMQRQGDQEDLLVALTFDLVTQFDKTWAQEFRTQKSFTRHASSLGGGESPGMSLEGRAKRALVMLASSLELDIPASSVIDKALETLGRDFDEENRFTK